MSDEKSAPTLIKPDLEFIRWITRSGGDSLKKCFQCATCSVACTLSPDDRPFPRKEMLWAQWGLKERLLADGDVWLCEQCNECSTQCPRGARPGDVMAAIRGYGLRHFAWPGWLGKALSQPRYLALLFAVPLLIGLILAQPSGPEGEFDVQFLKETTPPAPPFARGGFVPFEEFVSHGAIYGIFITLTAFIVLSVVISVRRFWAALSVRSSAFVVPPSGGPGPHGPTTNNLWPSVVSALKEILTHQQLRQCETGRPRYTAHLLIFYGFIGLLLMNVVVVVGLYGFGWKLPWAMDHPVKILAKVVGNLSGLAVVIGCLLAIAQRVRGRRATRQLGNWATGQLGNQPQSPEPNFLISQLPSASLGTSAYWDWLFVILLCAVAATGLVVEVSRLLTTGAAPYILYAVHLALVFFLIAYFPHSKFAHLIYRTVAKVHAKVYDRQGERGE